MKIKKHASRFNLFPHLNAVPILSILLYFLILNISVRAAGEKPISDEIYVQFSQAVKLDKQGNIEPEAHINKLFT